MLCADNWDSAAMHGQLVLLVIHVFELVYHNPISGANKGGGSTVPANQSYFILVAHVLEGNI